MIRIEERLLKPREAAPLLGIAERSVRLKCQLGLIGCEVELGEGGGRRYLIPESAIVAYRLKRARQAAA